MYHSYFSSPSSGGYGANILMTFYETCIAEMAKTMRIQYPYTVISVPDNEKIDKKDIKYAVEMLTEGGHNIKFIGPEKFQEFRGYMIVIENKFPRKGQ
jgi:hypothetical protein